MSADTIINCFKHCGVQPCTDEAMDPFAVDEESEAEQAEDGGPEDEELQELVQQFDPELIMLMLTKIYLPVTLVTTMKIGEMSCVMKYSPVVMQRNRLLVKMTQRKRMRVMRNLQAQSPHSEKLLTVVITC